jgi:bifunctional DNase/RNase
MEPGAFVEMRVTHIQYHPLTYPLVFLRTTTGTRYFLLPSPFDMSEPIRITLEEPTNSRPQPHDLLLKLLTATGGHIQRILFHESTEPFTSDAKSNMHRDGQLYEIDAQPRHIQRVRTDENRETFTPNSSEDVFTARATVELLQHGQLYQIDADPSDAVALALRAGAPIFMTQALLDQMIQHDEDYYEPSAELTRPKKYPLLKQLAPLFEVFAYQTLDEQYNEMPLEQKQRFAWEDHLRTSAGSWEGQPVHGLMLGSEDEWAWLLLAPEHWDLLQQSLESRADLHRLMAGASTSSEEAKD